MTRVDAGGDSFMMAAPVRAHPRKGTRGVRSHHRARWTVESMPNPVAVVVERYAGGVRIEVTKHRDRAIWSNEISVDTRRQSETLYRKLGRLLEKEWS